MSVQTCKNIYYTVYDDHAFVGQDNGHRQNAIATESQITSLSFESTINGKPVTGVFRNAFYGYEGVTSITFPDSIKIIEDSAFDMMRLKIATLNLPAHIEYIGQRSFAVSGYKSVYIPETVTYIGSSAFGSNPSLTTITIDPNNQRYIVTEDNCIYDYMKTILIQVPSDISNIKFAQSLVQIGSFAISSNNIKELIFPLSFSVLGQSSISQCENLKTVYFLGNLITVNNGAFDSCNKLTNIYYYGTVFVDVKIFSARPSNIRVCEGYKWNTFATYDNIINEGVCPPINYFKYKTFIICNPRFFSYYSYIFLLIKA